MQLEHHFLDKSRLPWTPYYPKKAFSKCNVEYIDSVTTNAKLMPKIIAFAFMRQAFLISCSLACTETKQDWLLIFLILRQLYFITNESLLYKQQKTKAWDKLTLPLPSMKAFRISGRDLWARRERGCQTCRLNKSLPHKRKRRRCRGLPTLVWCLNESLPHKRKRLLLVFGSSELPKL